MEFPFCMAEYKENDFVKIEFDIYANNKLVQTTNEKLGKEANLQIEDYLPQTIVLGKSFILKALDDAIIKGDNGELELKPDEAYGNRKKDYIKTFPKSAFDEHKLKPVVGITYDFNGMYGTVKSVTGGRIMVDFNNPLAGKDIKLNYKVLSKVDDMAEKISVVMETVLRIPRNLFEVSVADKNITLKAPQQFAGMEEMLSKTFKEAISDYKDYKLKIEVKEVNADA